MEESKIELNDSAAEVIEERPIWPCQEAVN